MTVEELRDEYQQNIKQYYENNDECEYVEIYPNDYSDWLEQKLTQPCPECAEWKHQYTLEMARANMAEVEVEKHKSAVKKLVRLHSEAKDKCETCPTYVDDSCDCWDTLEKWAYKEDV